MSAHVLTLVCGRMMPIAGERCTRSPGHRGYCRSGYDMGNARRHKALTYVPVRRDRTWARETYR